ncbi:MAG: glycosyltransferase family 2 protein [Candidatus Saccharibacteria bacterium]
MRVSETAVVIPAHNEAARIAHAIWSVGIQPEMESDVRPAVIVVDNDSTDGTADRARTMAGWCKEQSFNLHVITEPEPGIAAACNAGFRYAVEELDARVIACIDADTTPWHLWFPSLFNRHARQDDLALLSGPVDMHFDGSVRMLDDILGHAAKGLGKAIKAARYRELGMLRFAPGHNMSTTAEAFTKVGGFTPDAKISDDVDYNLKIMREFGARALGFELNMRAWTSARRLRQLGYLRTALYYATDKVRP